MINNFIVKNDEFAVLNDMINKIIKRKKFLPNMVFEKEYSNFLFEEFDWTMTNEFFEVLKELAQESDDPYILIAVVNPSPSKQFYKEFGYYNWLKIKTDCSANEYVEALKYAPENSIADSIIYNSQNIVWMVPSANWVIWGDRLYETCVFGCKFGLENNLNQILSNWKTVEYAIDSWISLSFEKQIVPKAFKNRLINSYKCIR